jgi:hypothetical protein
MSNEHHVKPSHQKVFNALIEFLHNQNYNVYQDCYRLIVNVQPNRECSNKDKVHLYTILYLVYGGDSEKSDCLVLSADNADENIKRMIQEYLDQNWSLDVLISLVETV